MNKKRLIKKIWNKRIIPIQSWYLYVWWPIRHWLICWENDVTSKLYPHCREYGCLHGCRSKIVWPNHSVLNTMCLTKPSRNHSASLTMASPTPQIFQLPTSNSPHVPPVASTSICCVNVSSCAVPRQSLARRAAAAASPAGARWFLGEAHNRSWNVQVVHIARFLTLR